MKSVARRSEDGAGWVAECSAHASYVNASSRRDAQETDTLEFCDECRETRVVLLSTCNERTLFAVHMEGCRAIERSLRIVSQHRIGTFLLPSQAIDHALGSGGEGDYSIVDVRVHRCVGKREGGAK